MSTISHCHLTILHFDGISLSNPILNIVINIASNCSFVAHIHTLVSMNPPRPLGSRVFQREIKCNILHASRWIIHKPCNITMQIYSLYRIFLGWICEMFTLSSCDSVVVYLQRLMDRVNQLSIRRGGSFSLTSRFFQTYSVNKDETLCATFTNNYKNT